MKCPKCHYISFDSGERCRNCGYEFSLTVDTAPVDLPIQTGDEALGPLGDFELEADAARSRRVSPAASSPTSSLDLPLFKERHPGDDAPLVTQPAAPRAPLSVRRSNPGPARGGPRPSIDEPVLDLDGSGRTEPRPERIEGPTESASHPEASSSDAAPVAPRLAAACLDAIILGAIGFLVLYLTLRVCGLEFSGVGAIPAAPFAAFLLLVAGGYLTIFTAAGGQTIGKMAAGIRVVPMDEAHARVPLGHSVLRAAVYLVSALPAGLGFLPALVGDDRRAIHDRLADTRVVKA